MTTEPATGHIDWSLYLVTDPDLGGGPDQVPTIVDAAVRGGVSVVQLRDKSADPTEFTARAATLARSLAGRVPLFVNDRVGAAIDLGLHLHIGQDDMPYRQARALLPDHLMIGLSVENGEHLEAVARDLRDGVRPPDVLGIGPVEQTSTKPDAAAPLGIVGVRRLASLARDLGIPSVAIGHVGLTNAADLVRTGVDGLCTVSAVMSATDPQASATALHTIITRTRQEILP
ncbi:thiamine phosphate synthase [Corynebacterium terpenotabidum]|uniref:Thiamine-phosphate synthase n=1 Tax=Corynebacterium terpenotabidum Y-11 TaxID=1200352 RepID=S4XC65_9CORY|nr:multifunctional thiamine-phosphate pyrophosphorylase/synthase/phosphomethylpyrimidine kinase [Corynebacterium terpenotabidum Y-11]